MHIIVNQPNLLNKIEFVLKNLANPLWDWMDFPLTKNTYCVIALTKRGLKLLNGRRVTLIPANDIYNYIGERSCVFNPNGGMGVCLGQHPRPKRVSPLMQALEEARNEKLKMYSRVLE